MKHRAGSVQRLATPVRAWAQRFTLLALVGFAFALLLLGKADRVLVERGRATVADTLAPVLDALSRPMETINDTVRDAKELLALRSENRILRRNNERLLRWQGVAHQLEAENRSLRDLVRLVPNPRQRFVTARVIGDQGGAFVRSVLINAGSNTGVSRGQAALTAEGLAGRVAQVGSRSARVLLITDMNSRVPVFVGPARDRAVVAGDNTNQPRLHYLGPRIEVRPGDRIMTSGHGGVLPPGLPIGVVASVGEGGIRVAPFADWARMEFLRVVDYDMPGLLRLSDPGR